MKIVYTKFSSRPLLPSHPYPARNLRLGPAARPGRRHPALGNDSLQSLPLHQEHPRDPQRSRQRSEQGGQDDGLPDGYEALCRSESGIRVALPGYEACKELCGGEGAAEGGGGGDGVCGFALKGFGTPWCEVGDGLREGW